jgi:hypothetical protein
MIYDITLTPEKIEAALDVLKRVQNAVRPSNAVHDSIDRVRSMLFDIHRDATRRRVLRESAEKIAD